MLPHVKHVYSWNKDLEKKEKELSELWFDAWKNRHIMYKENYIHLDCSHVLFFHFPLSICRLNLGGDPGKRDFWEYAFSSGS